MDPYKKFDTPIEHVTFFLGEKEFALTNVTERWIKEIDGKPVIIMANDQGKYVSVRNWDAMAQAAGYSFF